jgi:DNA processing protein
VANWFPPVTTTSKPLTPGVPGYPERLIALGWTPELRIRGELPPDAAVRSVAIVGARAASRVGMDRAHAAARHLAERGVHIVSGGALGIDGAAHRGALAGCGPTTAVLGSGVDVAYPARHARLFDQIIAGGGALVSMMPDGAEPRRGSFVARNPLIAALADVVVVVEADDRSGSLTTARAATKLGRLIVAYPGSRGCGQLLHAGAALAEAPIDIERGLAGEPRMPKRDVDPELQAIRAAHAGGARTVDAIAEATGLPVRTVLRGLPLIERYS